MRAIIIVLMWITPAIIAGILGWKGIWGAGSALTEFLIPIPVAGGVFHVPSYIVAVTVILTAHRLPESVTRLLPLIAIAVLLTAQTLQIDFERLNAWLFTDYSPYGSPLRFDGNPLLLFISTDAAWVFIYALLKGYVTPARYYLFLLLIPVAVTGLNAFTHKTAGPQFKIGVSQPVNTRGQVMHVVYTSAPYDEPTFSAWLDSRSYFARPWTNPNEEHAAIYFINSMQILKWGKYDEIDDRNTVATFCLYEEDQSIIKQAGHLDCFSGRRTVNDRLEELAAMQSTGLGKDIDYWYARLKLCEDIDIPDDYVSDIRLLDTCRSLVVYRERDLQRFIGKYGVDSDQVKFVQHNIETQGLADKTTGRH